MSGGGQAAIGKDITQTQVTSGAKSEVTQADLMELEGLLANDDYLAERMDVYAGLLS